jgi:hypothetical protein
VGDFAKYILFEDIESLFNEIDSIRNRKLAAAKLINPKTNKVWRAHDRWKRLAAIVNYEIKVNGVDPKRIWITFSHVSKFGQRTVVSGSKSTPVGIFGFPVSLALSLQDRLSFSDRPYIHVFKTKTSHLEVGSQGVQKDFETLKNSYPHLSSEDRIIEEIRSKIRKLEEETQIIASSWKPNDVTKSNDHGVAALFSIIHDVTWIVRDRITSNWSPDGLRSLAAESYFDMKEIMKPYDAKQSLAKLKTYLATQEFYVNGKHFYRYKNVQNDLGASLSPEYVEYLKSANPESPELQLFLHQKKLTFEQIRATNPYAFDYHSTGRILETQHERNRSIYNSRSFRMIINDLITKIKYVLLEVANRPVPPPKDMEKLPYGKQLKDFAEKHGLDFNMAAKDAFHKSTTPNRFLYRAAEALARQLAGKQRDEGKKKTWQMAWNTVLRSLGVHAVADTKNTGHIHASEMTQGVFMDPERIEHIATIIQRSHSSGLDPANRPTKSDWESNTHIRTKLPTDQRKGKTQIDRYSPNNATPEDDYFNGLWSRAKQLIDENYMGMVIYSQSVPTYIEFLTNLIRLVKSYRKLLKQGYKPQEDYFKTVVNEAIKRLKEALKHSREITKHPIDGVTSDDDLNKIEDKVLSLDSLLQGEEIKSKSDSENKATEKAVAV